MNKESFFPKNIKAALQNNPPGEWFPSVPANAIRLHSGYPAPHLVPSKELKEAVAQLLEEENDLPLHYIGSPRIDKLKEWVRIRQEERGMPAKDEELLITSGACQAIDLIARIFLDEEAVVIVESPTYMEALEIFHNYTNRIITVPIDKDGLQTELLAEMLAERKKKGMTKPAFLYTIPTFHNPTGTTMSDERRRHVIDLAEEYDFLVLEDDAYGELGFTNNPKTLKSMDTEDRVLYVGSLSKVVAPGMRIGWVHATERFIQALFWFKKDLEHPFSQATMATLLENTNFTSRLQTLSKTYQKKCRVMLVAIEKYLPENTTWFVPGGGYFVWVKVPDVDTEKLLSKATEEGVSFLPGKYFFLDQTEGAEYLRLSFSYENEENIEKGIKILGDVLKSWSR
ncbi:PLP-dependent aminotransferase family protein [Bacillus sp. RO1]|uniref:aminotransferase-like domain-containing protein n=1 Tax=Bacillus sp. RO1 TaxID=2722703 RepID=UPI001456EE92|nr:PLP-dependent aminotransferase family protein [Bacillus sp. RO1]NLP49834.1 PLP-dependent aminotransferase family protein [Bacillus sp. RO1]